MCGAGSHPGGGLMGTWQEKMQQMEIMKRSLEMLQQESLLEISLYETPFHERTSELNILNEWTRWKDYTVPNSYFEQILNTLLQETPLGFLITRQ